MHYSNTYSHATKFFGKLNSDKTINLNANFLDLIYSIALRNPIHIPPLPNLNISTTQLPPIFEPSQAYNTLQSFTHYNSSLSELTFYTDGSVINLGNPQCSMGIGWIQLANQNIIHIFQAQIKFWPCSFKAELLAILAAISTAPRNCTIQIYTDSQSVSSKFKSLINIIPLPNFLNIPYWSIWNTLLNLIKSCNLNITLHKVNAHEDDNFNNKADQLARNHHIAPYLIYNSNNIYNPQYISTSDNYPMELPICHSIRTICKAHIIAWWTLQNCFQQWNPILQLINWKASW